MTKTTKTISLNNLDEKQFTLTSTVAGIDVDVNWIAKFDTTENEWLFYTNENVDLSESDLTSLLAEIKKLN